MKRIHLIFFFLVILQSGFAYTLRQYKVENGLSQNTVWCILQDKKGFMWFGTKDGLDRFDGINFKTYIHDQKNPKSIGNNFIRSLYQESDHQIWIGTDKKMYIYNPEYETFSCFNNRSKQGTKITEAVNSIVCDRKGNIWMAVFGQGVFCYNKITHQLNNYSHNSKNIRSLSSNLAWTIYVDQDDVVWIGTLRGGLNRYNSRKNDFDVFMPYKNKNSISSADIYCIYNDSNNNLWIGTWNGGLSELNRVTGQFTNYFAENKRFSEMHIRTIREFNKGSLLIGSDFGLFLFDISSKNITEINNNNKENNLSDKSIYSIYQDSEKGIWIGTYFGGVNYLHPNNQIFDHWYTISGENSLSGKAISQICEDNLDNIWIATEDAGLNKYNPKTKIFTHYSQSTPNNYISNNNVHSLLYNEGKLWIGTFTKGVDILDLRTNRIKNYQNRPNDTNSLSDNGIYAIYKDKDGQIYIGTINGLNIYNKKTDNFKRVTEIGLNTYIYDILQDSYGFLWFATYGRGVFKYNPRTNIWKQYVNDVSNPKSICHDKVISLCCDSKNRLWFGTEGGGICEYDYKTDHFINRINHENGLPNDVVYCIVEDNNKTLWLSTNNSLVHFFPDIQKFKAYTYEDGLQSNQFNYKSGFKSKSGVMYFGGVNGLNVFKPQDIVDNKFVPPVVISEMQIGNKIVNVGEKNSPLTKSIIYSNQISLNYTQSNFSFDFVSLSYCSPTKNKYAYKLEPQDKVWNYIGGQHKIFYNNLSPGEYTLYVKASNNDNIWNEQGTKIKLVIKPPFWLSIYAKIFYWLIGIGIVAFLILFFIRRSERKHKKALENYEAKREAEIYDSQITFFTNIAHEIRTPLSLIKAPLESIINSNEGSEDVKENLHFMQLNTERLHSLINQLLDFRKIDQGRIQLNKVTTNINELLENTISQFKRVAEVANINIELIISETPCFESVDSESITKVVSNLLTNALKYTKDYIQVKLIPATTELNFFQICVSDNGIGIPDEFQQKIFDPFYQIENNPKINYFKKEGTGIGLAYAKSIVEMHSGKIELESKKKEGSTFIVKLPHTLLDVLIKPDIEEYSFDKGIEVSIDRSKEIPVILIVEDNKELRNYLERSLSGSYIILTAENGIPALDILKKYPVNLIVSDLIMPEMDGLEFCLKVKEEVELSHIPIIILTAKTDNSSKIESLKSGADVYIEKPFSIEYLMAQISSIFENREKICKSFISSPNLLLSSIANNKSDEEFLLKINNCIEENITNFDFSVEILAKAMCMSRSNILRKIKGISGLSPNDFIRLVRLKKAAELLREGKFQITEICYMVGFNTPSYFAKCFHKQFGILPKDFVNKSH